MVAYSMGHGRGDWRSMMKPRFIIAGLIVVLAAVWPLDGRAMVEVERSFSQLVQMADVILVGTATDSRTEWGQGQQASTIFTVVTLENLDVIKGQAPGAPYEFRYVGGRLGDMVQYYEGMPQLQVGTRYLLFIAGETNLLFPTIGISQGVFVVEPTPGQASDTILSYGREEVLEVRNDQIRTSGTGPPLSADEFIACIDDQMAGRAQGACQPARRAAMAGPHPLDCSDHPTALVCYKFTDAPSVSAVWADPGAACAPQAAYDEQEYAGRLTVAGPCHGFASGEFRFFWPRQTGQLWIQFRYKPEAALLTEPAAYGLPGYRVVAAGEGLGSCGSTGLIESNERHRGYPQWSDGCGAEPLRRTLPEGQLDLQPGGDTVCYGQDPAERPPEKCLFYAGAWATTTYHMDLDGSRHGGEAWVDGWMQYDGGVRVHVLSAPLEFTGAVEHAYFAPHMVGKDASRDHPAWRVWYQDILVTTEPLF